MTQIPPTAHKMTVTEVRPLASDILLLLAKPTENFNYIAGQYVMLGLDQDDLKPFSIASAPREDGQLEFHIRNLPDNDWMATLFDINVYDTLFVQGPNDQYKVDSENTLSTILVAGGTGFAPMKALLDELLASDYDGLIEFYWGARKVSDLYMHTDMLQLCKQDQRLNYIPVISEEESAGRTGLAHLAVLQDHPDLSNFRVYICGPWPMQEAAKTAFFTANLLESHYN